MSEKGIYRGELLELSSSSMVVYHTHKWNVPNSQESPSPCHAEGLLKIRAGNNPGNGIIYYHWELIDFNNNINQINSNPSISL